MGPLAGLRVVEFEAIGPGPFCGMLLADLGAEVLVVDRAVESGLGLPRERRHDAMMRGKRSLMLDLKRPGAADAAIRIVGRADAIIEGFRPGVMERLGLGPEALLAAQPKLVYGRMTGWGQDGPLAPRAGHDIDYIALSGVLGAIGRRGEAPVPPLNLVGDFGGGGLLLAFGMMAALWEAQRSGRGQVVDAAMFEGASLLATMFHGLIASGRWQEARAANHLDTGAPWYEVYETADGGHMAVGAIEDKFYAELLARLDLDPATLPSQHDRARWPELRTRLATTFAARPRAEWERVFAGSDACVAPVLGWSEARAHPHAKARASFLDVAGVPQPAPAPRFSRTPASPPSSPPGRGEGGEARLADWGFTDRERAELAALGCGYADGGIGQGG